MSGEEPKVEQISKAEWNERLASTRVSKHDLNKLVMNYLVIEGYKTAAQNFEKESGI